MLISISGKHVYRLVELNSIYCFVDVCGEDM